MPTHARESEIERLTTRPVRMYHRRDFLAARNVVPTPQPVYQCGCYVSVCDKVTKYASEDEAAKAVEEMKKEMR